MAKRKMSPTKVLDSLGVWNGRSVAAHAVWVDEADLAILKARGVGIGHCPSSNMKLASGVAPVTRMLALNMAVGVGTGRSGREQQRFQFVRGDGSGGRNCRRSLR